MADNQETSQDALTNELKELSTRIVNAMIERAVSEADELRDAPTLGSDKSQNVLEISDEGLRINIKNTLLLKVLNDQTIGPDGRSVEQMFESPSDVGSMTIRRYFMNAVSEGKVRSEEALRAAVATAIMHVNGLSDLETQAQLEALNGFIWYPQGPVYGVPYTQDPVEREAVTQPSVASKNSEEPPVIVLDVGHGLYKKGDGDIVPDSGTVDGEDVNEDGEKQEEAALNLAFAKKLKEKLETQGFRVVLTRDSADTVLDSRFQSRIDIALENNAAMFASIHHNGYDDHTAHGGEVLYRNDSSLPYVKAIERELSQVITTRDSTQKNYKVLRASDKTVTATDGAESIVRGLGEMPALFIEPAFMTNKRDLNNALDPEWQDKVAGAVARGMTSYYKQTIQVKDTTLPDLQPESGAETLWQVGTESGIDMYAFTPRRKDEEREGGGTDAKTDTVAQIADYQLNQMGTLSQEQRDLMLNYQHEGLAEGDKFSGSFQDFLERNEIDADKLNDQLLMENFLIFSNRLLDRYQEVCVVRAGVSQDEIVHMALIYEGRDIKTPFAYLDPQGVPLVGLTLCDPDRALHCDKSDKILTREGRAAAKKEPAKAVPEIADVTQPAAANTAQPEPAKATPAPSASQQAPAAPVETAQVTQTRVALAQFVGQKDTRGVGQSSVDIANYFMGSPATDPAAHGGSPFSVWEGTRILTTFEFLDDLSRGAKGERRIDTALAKVEQLLEPEQVARFEVTKDNNIKFLGIVEGKEKRFKYETSSVNEVWYKVGPDGTFIPEPVAVGLVAGATISLARKEGGHNTFVDAKTARADFGELLATPEGKQAFTGYTVVDNEKAYQETRFAEAAQAYDRAKQFVTGAGAGFLASDVARKDNMALAVHAVQMMAHERQAGKDGPIRTLINDFDLSGREDDGKFERLLERQAKAFASGETDLAGVREAVKSFVEDAKNQGEVAAHRQTLLQDLNRQLANNEVFAEDLAKEIGTAAQHQQAMHDAADKYMQMQMRQLVNPAVWSVRPFDGVETQHDILMQTEIFLNALPDEALRTELQGKYMGLTHLAPSILKQELEQGNLLSHNPAQRQIEARIKLDFIQEGYGGEHDDAQNKVARRRAEIDQAEQYGIDAWRAVEEASFRGPSGIEIEVGTGLMSDASFSRSEYQGPTNILALKAEKSATFPKQTSEGGQDDQKAPLGELRDWMVKVSRDPNAMQALLLAAIAKNEDGSLKHPAAMDALLQTVWYSTRDDSFFGFGTGTQGAKDLGFAKDSEADEAAKRLEAMLGEHMEGDLRYRDYDLLRSTFAGLVRLGTIGVFDIERGDNAMDVISEDAIPSLQEMAVNDPEKFAQVAQMFGDYMYRAATAERSAQFAANIATGLTRREGEVSGGINRESREGKVNGGISGEMIAFYAAANTAAGLPSGGSQDILDRTFLINNHNWAGLEQAHEAYVLQGKVLEGIDNPANFRREIRAGNATHQRTVEVEKGQEHTVPKYVFVSALDVSDAQAALAAQREANDGKDLTALRGAALADALLQNLSVYAKHNNPEKFTLVENNSGLARQMNRSSPALLAAHAVQMMAAEEDTRYMNSTARNARMGEISKIVNNFARHDRRLDGKLENLLEDLADDLRAGKIDDQQVLVSINEKLTGRHGEKYTELLTRLNAQLAANPHFTVSFSESLTSHIQRKEALERGVDAEFSQPASLDTVLVAMGEEQQAIVAGLFNDPAALNAMARADAATIASLLAERGVSWIEAVKLSLILAALLRDGKKKEQEQEQEQPEPEPEPEQPIGSNPEIGGETGGTPGTNTGGSTGMPVTEGQQPIGATPEVPDVGTPATPGTKPVDIPPGMPNPNPNPTPTPNPNPNPTPTPNPNPNPTPTPNPNPGGTIGGTPEVPPAGPPANPDTKPGGIGGVDLGGDDKPEPSPPPPEPSPPPPGEKDHYGDVLNVQGILNPEQVQLAAVGNAHGLPMVDAEFLQQIRARTGGIVS